MKLLKALAAARCWEEIIGEWKRCIYQVYFCYGTPSHDMCSKRQINCVSASQCPSMMIVTILVSGWLEDVFCGYWLTNFVLPLLTTAKIGSWNQCCEMPQSRCSSVNVSTCIPCNTVTVYPKYLSWNLLRVADLFQIAAAETSFHWSSIQTSSREMETDANGCIKWLLQPLADLSNRPFLPDKSNKGTRHNPKIFSSIPASQLPNHGEGLNRSEHNSNDMEGHLGHIAYSFFRAKNPA